MTLTAEIEGKMLADIKSGRYVAGEKMPTLKQLCLLYGASEITLRNAVRNLRDAKVLDARQGSGIYVIEKRPEKTATVGVFFPRAEVTRDDAVHQAYFSSLDELIVKRNKRADYGYNLWVSGETPTAALVRSARLDGAIFLGQTISPELLASLESAGTPYVVAGGVAGARGGARFVDYDHLKALRAGLDHLWKLGHERIGCLLRKSLNANVETALSRGFYDEMFRRGRRISKDQLAIVDGVERIAVAYDRMMSQSKVTAIYCRGPFEAETLYDHATRSGVRIPKDLSLIAYGFSEFYPNPRAISAQYVYIEEYAEALLQSIKKQLNGVGSGATIVLDSEWREGKTLGPAPREAKVPAGA